MHITDWIVVGLYLLGVILTITQIGQPRKLTTPSVAACVVVVYLTLIVALLWSHGVIA